MLNIKNHSVIFFLILLLVACHNNLDKDEQKFQTIIPDTSITHRPDIFYEFKKKAADELLLNKLENGSDTLELRLWAKVEILIYGEVFVIKQINNKWTCLHYYYIENNPLIGHGISEWVNHYTIDTFWVKKQQPKTDWISFLTSLEKENIYNLPVQSEIKQFKSEVCDGYTYCIEYATKHKYKFYWYNCPDLFADKFKECKQMTNILDIFNREFGITMFGHNYKCKIQ